MLGWLRLGDFLDPGALVGRPDAHTPWFTDTGVIYYSHWATPIFGKRGVRMEYEPR